MKLILPGPTESTGAEVMQRRDDPADKHPPQLPRMLPGQPWLLRSVLAESCPVPQSTGAGIIKVEVTGCLANIKPRKLKRSSRIIK